MHLSKIIHGGYILIGEDVPDEDSTIIPHRHSLLPIRAELDIRDLFQGARASRSVSCSISPL